MSLLLLFRPRAGTAPLIGCDLAQENGDKLLLEDGGAIVLDGYTCDVTPVTTTQGGKLHRRPIIQVFALTEEEDDELMTWIQTHRPDPLRRR